MIKNAKIIGSNISYEVYSRQAPGVSRGHPDFVMSRSEFVELAICPERWRDGVDEDDEGTAATFWGSLIDVLAMTPERFDDLYAVAPPEYEDEKTGKMKPWNWNAGVCKAWREDQGEREVLKKELKEKADLAVAKLRADKDITDLFACSLKQVMCVAEWHDKMTKRVVPLRVLIDLIPDKNHPVFGKWVCNFKTARNGNPDRWDREVDDKTYDVSAALELDIYKAASGEDRTDFVFPLQENIKPYHVVKPFPALTSEFLEWGRAKYQAALTIYARCLATNHWPSYSTSGRPVIGPIQLIGPENLFKYRESGGQFTSRMEYESEPPRKEPASNENDIGH